MQIQNHLMFLIIVIIHPNAHTERTLITVVSEHILESLKLAQLFFFPPK